MMEGLITTLSAALSNGTNLGQTVVETVLDTVSTVYGNETLLNNGATELKESPRDSLYIVIPVTIIYISVFFTGTIGNISTCIVIARNKSMHTATNYYLFSLAISDLLLLVSGLPAEIYLVWYKYPYIFGEAFCILRGLAAETSTNASVLTITAFTVERYVAICHPFLSQTMSKLSRAVKLILVIWLVALSFAIPQALQFGVVVHETRPEMVMCTLKTILVKHSFELSTFLFFIVPMILITVLYALIGLRLRKSNMMKKSTGRNQLSGNNRHPGRSSQRVLKMLVAVVIAFFVCWAPFHVQRLIAIYGTDSRDRLSSKNPVALFLYLLMTYISGVLYYISTTINPILYNIMSNKFRVAFMETLSRSCRVPGLKIRHEQRSDSSLSRSQQRTVGGSKTTGPGGTMRDSTDGSRNSRSSGREENSNPKMKTRSAYQAGNGEAALLDNEDKSGAEESEQRCQDRPEAEWPLKPTMYTTVTGLDEPAKKWWRFLKWLQGIRSLKLVRRRSYATRVIEDPRNNREEFSMAIWTERNGPRPV